MALPKSIMLPKSTNGNRMYFLIALLVFLCLGFLQAQAKEIVLHSSAMIDFSDLYVYATYENGSFYGLFPVQNNNLLLLQDQPPSSLFFYIKKDHLYRGKYEKNQAAVMMIPVGKVSGYVVDEKENLIKHAALMFHCDDASISYPKTTDELGFFYLPSVGYGTCTIAAIHNQQTAVHTIIINQSSPYLVKIVLQQNNQKNSSLLIIFMIFLIFGLGLGTYYLSSFILKKIRFGVKSSIKSNRDAEDTTPALFSNAGTQEKYEPKDNKQETMSKDKLQGQVAASERQQAILTTLQEKELTVMNQLMVKDGLTQSQLRHYLSLPKSTLNRTLAKLEQKNLIIQKEEAGIKKVFLSKFFLEGKKE